MIGQAAAQSSAVRAARPLAAADHMVAFVTRGMLRSGVVLFCGLVALTFLIWATWSVIAQRRSTRRDDD